ncbi:MAG: 3-isopropylmalate dehydratase large subunit [Zetaproteobacteria bacterium]|nr:3-isopropylmalate dehydratase large subunit [Pseudobdellovibrionaceae bacterium]
MRQTLVEKIISNKIGRKVKAGEFGVFPVDMTMASDTTAPHVIRSFHEMGGTKVHDCDGSVLIIDHAAPAPNERIANLHKMMRKFADEQNCILYESGRGICHHVMMEEQHVKPGMFVVGADSHSCTYGAMGAFGTGMGSTDLAAIWLTGKTWLRVPTTIKVILDGELADGVTTKDVTIALVGKLGIAGATYQVIEFDGPFIENLSFSARIPFANMSVEMGAKGGIVVPHGLRNALVKNGYPDYDFDFDYPDDGATYSQTIHFDVSHLGPQLSEPGKPDQVISATSIEGKKIDIAFVGTCTNGSLEDLRTVAHILKGQSLARGVRLMISPASRQVLDHAIEDGTLLTLSRAGATILPSGCGPCVGTHLGVPGDGEVVISAANRNFTGRMGNPKASVYLASPVTVARSAIKGYITGPAEVLNG